MKTILLSLICSVSMAQEAFQVEMDVKRDTKLESECTRGVVLFGFKDDSFAFQYRNEIYQFDGCFVISSSENDRTVQCTEFLLQEKYQIRFLTKDYITFIVVNIEHNFPNFVLSTKQICK